MTRAVITGATGMLGATLARELLAHGDTVLAVCRRGSAKRSNLPEHPRLGVLELDLDAYAGFTREALRQSLAGADVDAERFLPPYDVCYHFAWNGTYGAAREDIPLQESNVRHTLDAVALAARLGCKRFIGAGSQAEYGRVAAGVRLAPDTPVHPISGYGAAKLSAGLLGALHAKTLGLHFIWVRVLSVYGPMDNAYTLTVSTIRKLQRHEPVDFTAGEQLWDFLFSEDAARAFRLVGERGRAGATYVLGSGSPVRLADALSTLARLTDPDAQYTLGALPYRPDQCMYLCADLTALAADVGFAPAIPYAEGVRRTVEWCARNPT